MFKTSYNKSLSTGYGTKLPTWEQTKIRLLFASAKRLTCEMIVDKIEELIM